MDVVSAMLTVVELRGVEPLNNRVGSLMLVPNQPHHTVITRGNPRRSKFYLIYRVLMILIMLSYQLPPRKLYTLFHQIARLSSIHLPDFDHPKTLCVFAPHACIERQLEPRWWKLHHERAIPGFNDRVLKTGNDFF